MSIYPQTEGFSLYKKTHNKTGLMYLGYTEKDDIIKYKGSGVKWLKHLEEYGNDVTTELLLFTYSHEEIKYFGKYYSELWNIVESDNWANERPEQGYGGNTVSNKMWITNGNEEKYILKDSHIPEGWKKGRSKRCVFNNTEKQKEFAKRDKRTSEERSKILKKLWSEGIFDNRDISKIGKNQNWTEEKRKRSSIAAKNRKKIECPYCKKLFQPCMAKRWHFDNCKMKNND